MKTEELNKYARGVVVSLPDPGPAFPRRYGFGSPRVTACTGFIPTATTGGGFPRDDRIDGFAYTAQALQREQEFDELWRASKAKMKAEALERRAYERMLDLIFTPTLYSWVFVMLALVVASLQGCASFTKPAREVRVTEYTGKASPGLVGAPYVSGDLVVGGCRLVLSVADSKGCMRYKGKACSYSSQDCTP